MTKIKKIKITFLFFAVYFLFFPFLVEAAQFFFDTKRKEIGIGDQIKIDFLFSSEENVNAFDGKMVFSSNLLDLKDVQDGNTIVNFWIEKPEVQKNEIIFSGITPGGFKGENGLIFSAIFEAKEKGTVVFTINDGMALLNDGQGTAAELSIINFELLIEEGVETIPIERVQDTDPPESFVPGIARDQNIFEGKWFLVFATQDKGSGIAYYAIHETTRKKEATRIDAKDWLKTESPYVLKDQDLRNYIYVKAIDKAGNERIAEVAPRHPIKWYEMYEIWGIIIIIIIVGVIFITLIWLRKRRKVINS